MVGGGFAKRGMSWDVKNKALPADFREAALPNIFLLDFQTRTLGCLLCRQSQFQPRIPAVSSSLSSPLPARSTFPWQPERRCHVTPRQVLVTKTSEFNLLLCSSHFGKAQTQRPHQGALEFPAEEVTDFPSDQKHAALPEA